MFKGFLRLTTVKKYPKSGKMQHQFPVTLICPYFSAIAEIQVTWQPCL